MSAGPARGTASRAARVFDLVVVVVVLAVAALAFVVRFDRPERHTSGDTYFYALEAERYAGVPAGQATNDAKRLLCSDIRLGLHLDGTRAPSCVEYVAITAPRYVEIFTSRPLWPLLLAPVVALVGLTRAIIWVSLLGALLGALAVFLALRRLGNSIPAAGAAGVAFSLLPTGYWSDQLLPEGAVLVVLVVAIYGASQAVRSRWWGLAMLVPALVGLYALKPANGAALAGGLVVAGVLLLPLPGRKGRLHALSVAGVGVVGLAGWIAISNWLGLPSLNDTVQDLATRHFTKPDVPDPAHVLKTMNLRLWQVDVGRWLGLPWPLTIALVAAVVTVLGLRRAGMVWAAVSLGGISIVVVHPMLSQYDRLVVSVWLVVIAAVAVVVDLPARLPERSRPARFDSRETIVIDARPQEPGRTRENRRDRRRDPDHPARRHPRRPRCPPEPATRGAA
jgi:hypothetical protein